jgi:hypothetical protein
MKKPGLARDRCLSLSRACTSSPLREDEVNLDCSPHERKLVPERLRDAKTHEPIPRVFLRLGELLRQHLSNPDAVAHREALRVGPHDDEVPLALHEFDADGELVHHSVELTDVLNSLPSTDDAAERECVQRFLLEL